MRHKRRVMPKNCNGNVNDLRQRLDDFLRTRRGDGRKYVLAIIRAVATTQTFAPATRNGCDWVSHRQVHAEVRNIVPHGKTVYRILHDLVKTGILEEEREYVSEIAPVTRKRYYRVPLSDPLAIMLTAEELRFYNQVLLERARACENGIQRNIALAMLREEGVVNPEREMYRRYAKVKPRFEYGYGLAALILDGGPGFVAVPEGRLCEECGADIAGKNASARFCSSACRQAHYRKSKKD